RLGSVDSYDDGRYDVEVVARRRVRLDAMVSSDSFMWGQVEYLPEVDGPKAQDAADRAHAVFDAYRGELRTHQLDSTITDLPADPAALSYALAATAVLTLRDQQGLLEAPDAATRLRQFSRLLVSEISAMRAIPSLPAVEVARTSWSPN
ncbi:MAG: LON peptidase substrate-binding domain-containing protein, partial [Nocardioidaceae bacterium]